MGPEQSRMPFILLIKLQVGSFADRTGKCQAGGNYQCVIVVCGNDVLLCQLRGLLRLVFVSPCHEKSRPGHMLHDGIGLLLHVFVKKAF